jgi:hypothetical protein
MKKACLQMVRQRGFIVVAFLSSMIAIASIGNETNKVRILAKAALGGIAVSNELIKISATTSASLEIRQLAMDALQNHNSLATNSYLQIESFINGWSIHEEPPLTQDTITVMRTVLEIGDSAFSQLQAYSGDTNKPPELRRFSGTVVTNIINSLQCSPIVQ